MSTTDTNVPQVIINKLTSAEYTAATKSPTEFYAVTDAKVDTADIQDGAITTAKIANGAVTSDKIDFTTLRNIDVSSYFTINATVTRAFITVFGKIGFVNLAFTPADNLPTSPIMELPASLGISPLYTSELVGMIASDNRRTLISSSSGGSQIVVDQHTSSASKFIRIFGMFFLS